MSLRERTISYGQVTGRKKIASTAWSYVTADLGSSTCEDILTERYDDSDKVLLIQHDRRTGGIIDGKSSNSGTATQFEGYPLSDGQTDAWLGNATILNAGESELTAALRAKAMTNPSRNELQLPVFMWELKDIPGMIRHAGQLIGQVGPTKLDRKDWSKFQEWWRKGIPYGETDTWRPHLDLASSILAYNFGWAPLVSDLHKMITFADSVEKRKKELNRLYSGEGLKRRVTLEDYSGREWTANVYVSSSGTNLTTSARAQASLKRWAVLKWKPQGNPLEQFPRTDQDVRNLILGLNASSVAGHIWEALPWSWLIDYFAKVGSLINASNNAVGAQLNRCSIMTTSSRRLVVDGFTRAYPAGTTITMSTCTREVVIKKRYPNAFPSAQDAFNFPIFTGKQLSILSSLAVMRMR